MVCSTAWDKTFAQVRICKSRVGMTHWKWSKPVALQMIWTGSTITTWLKVELFVPGQCMHFMTGNVCSQLPRTTSSALFTLHCSHQLICVIQQIYVFHLYPLCNPLNGIALVFTNGEMHEISKSSIKSKLTIESEDRCKKIPSQKHSSAIACQIIGKNCQEWTGIVTLHAIVIFLKMPHWSGRSRCHLGEIQAKKYNRNVLWHIISVVDKGKVVKRWLKLLHCMKLSTL